MSPLPVLARENVLPRVWCYFDGIFAGSEELLTDIVWERAAISDFNLSPEWRKLNDSISLACAFKRGARLSHGISKFVPTTASAIPNTAHASPKPRSGAACAWMSGAWSFFMESDLLMACDCMQPGFDNYAYGVT